MPGAGEMVLCILLLQKAQASMHCSVWIASYSMLTLRFALVLEVWWRDGEEKEAAILPWMRCYFQCHKNRIDMNDLMSKK